MAEGWSNLDEAFAELEAECTDVTRGLAVRIWNGILSKTPQYLGRMAASWTFSITEPQFVDRSALVDPAPEAKSASGYIDYGQFTGLWRGNPAAIAIANSASEGKDKSFKLGDVIFISNGVNHGEGAYSQDVEDGNVTLRAVNQPGAPVARTLDWASVYFNNITPQKALSLKVLTIGSPDASTDS